ncbi:hypothetical protein [Mesorhizobium sp. A556]
MDMAEIRFRAERRLGELWEAQKAAHGTAQGRRSDLGFSETQVASAPITLAEAGIDKNLADRARKFAAIPDDEFDGIVGDWREKVLSDARKPDRGNCDAVEATRFRDMGAARRSPHVRAKAR